MYWKKRVCTHTHVYIHRICSFRHPVGVLEHILWIVGEQLILTAIIITTDFSVCAANERSGLFTVDCNRQSQLDHSSFVDHSSFYCFLSAFISIFFKQYSLPPIII